MATYWWEDEDIEKQLPPDVLHELDFYKKESNKARNYFRILEILIILVTASVPAAAAAGAAPSILGVLGAVAAVLAGIRAVFRFHDTAAAFMRALNAIEAQIVLFLHHGEPYLFIDQTRTSVITDDEQRALTLKKRDLLSINVQRIVAIETDSYASRLAAARLAQGTS